MVFVTVFALVAFAWSNQVMAAFDVLTEPDSSFIFSSSNALEKILKADKSDTFIFSLPLSAPKPALAKSNNLFAPVPLQVIGGFNIDGNVPDAGTTNFPDPSGNSDELGPINGSTTKLGVVHTDVPPTLGFTNPNAQTDLRNIWLKTNTAANGDVWLYFAWERDSANGSGVIMYEFQQAAPPASCNYSGSQATLLASCNPWANRQAGDFIIVWDQQGNNINIIKRTFMLVNGQLVLDAGVTLNSTVSDAAISADGFFGEGAINLTRTIFPPNPTSCFTIANIIPGTVTGNSDTADYKDVVLADFSSIFISNCGGVKVTKVTNPAGETGNFQYTLKQSDNGAIRYDGTTQVNGTLTSDGDFDQINDLRTGNDYMLTEDLTGEPAWALQSIVCNGVNVTSGQFSVVALSTGQKRIGV